MDHPNEEMLSQAGQPGPEQQAERESAALLAKIIYGRTAQSLVAPLRWLRRQAGPDMDEALLSRLLAGVDEGSPREGLEDAAQIRGRKDSYYYSPSIMTAQFARVQALIEDKDMLATIAEVTRRDCELYPRPAPFSKFSGYPFRFSADELEGAAARMKTSDAYADIGVVSASNGAKAFYSSKFLSKAYAGSLFEEIEVESREWQ